MARRLVNAPLCGLIRLVAMPGGGARQLMRFPLGALELLNHHRQFIPEVLEAPTVVCGHIADKFPRENM